MAEIKQPDDIISTSPYATAKLSWKPSLSKKMNDLLAKDGKIQKYVDSTVLAQIPQYTPRLTGVLIKSATIHTVIGSGLIEWRTPYARVQYYTGRSPGGDTGLRGRLWCERWKSDRLDEVLKGAKDIARREFS